jgi:hypothetical protein
MSAYTDLLADADAQLALLVVVSGLNAQSGLVETYYFCDQGTANTPASGFITEPTDTPANQIFEPRIISALSIDASVAQKDQFGGESFPAYGPWQFDNTDGGSATLTSLVVSGNIATAACANPHPWGNGALISIRGAASAVYNVTRQPVTVPDGPAPTTFSFPLVTANATVSGPLTATSGLDNWRTLSFDGQLLIAYIVGTRFNGTVVGWAQAGVPFTGTVAGDALVDEQKATLNARDLSAYLSRDVQTHLYRGMSNCLALDGATQYAVLTSFASSAEKTYECWFRCKGNNGAANTQTVAFQGVQTGANNEDWHIQIDTAGHVGFVVYNGGASSVAVTASTADYRDGKWHHAALAITTAGALMSAYLDGVLVGTATPGAFTVRTGNLVAGVGTGGNYFYGEIDEIRFWSVALGQLEIQQNMARERVADSRMRGYWRCNDNINNSLFDASNNGLTGRLTGNVANNMWTWSGEGYPDIAGQQKPFAVGPIAEFSPTLVDPGRLIYQAHDGAILGVPWVWDKTGPLTPAVSWQILDAARGFLQLLVAPQGKISCSVQPATNIFGSCLSFDGATGFASATSMPCPAGSMSLEALVRLRAMNAANVKIATFSASGGVAAGLRQVQFMAAGLAQFSVRNDAGTAYSATAAVPATPGLWYWVAGVLDVPNLLLTLYVNGISVATAAVTGTFNTVLSNFYIGRRDDAAQYFPGEIDEVRIWNVVLSAATINANMMRELAGNETGLVHYWDFDDNAGTTTADEVAGGATVTLGGPAGVAASSTAISVSSTDNSYNRAAGSFVADGFTVGQLVQAFGFANGANNVQSRIVTVAAGKITVNVLLTTEAAATGQTLITAAGCAWAPSRYSRADLAYWLVTASPNAPLKPAQIALASFVQFNIDDSSDNGELCEAKKARTFLSVLDALINWDGYYGGTRAGLLQVACFNPPTGLTSAGDFDDSAITGDLVPVAQALPVYGVQVQYAQNWAVSSPQDIIGIIQSNSARYSFATNQWRTAPSGQTVPTSTYPDGGLLLVPTTLQSQAAAQTLSDRLYGIYSVRHDYYEAPLTIVPLSLDTGAEITLQRNRLGLDGKRWFRLVGYKTDVDLRQMTAKVWA